MQFNLEYVEFYITNVCNLNCDRCNRFNNYVFGGHFNWDEHEQDYQQWSKILDIKRIGILGGEPMAHPDFYNWVSNIATLWPNSNIMIMSNGTYLKNYPGFYDFLAKYQGRIRLDISRHNKNHRDKTLQDIQNLYPGQFNRYDLVDNDFFQSTGIHGYHSASDQLEIKVEIDPKTINPAIWADKSYQCAFTDQSDVLIRYSDADAFDESVVRFDHHAQRLYLTEDSSNPDLAIDACSCKYSHHFINGKLYKCGVLGVLPEFLSQFPVVAAQNKVDLLNSYQAAEYTWEESRLWEFIENLSQGRSIPQCSLCPESFSPKSFSADGKKIKVQKK